MRRLLITLPLLMALVVPATAATKPPKPPKPTKPVKPPKPAKRSGAKVTIGIADNKALTFSDPRFLDLHIKYARINVPWDVLSDANTLQAVDSWMDGAKLAGVKPLVSFDRSRVNKRANPSPGQLANALTAWRARWPGQISDVSAWNEPNINGKSGSRVAKWWLALRAACPSCTVLPGELVDRTNAVKWTQDFVKAAKRQPAIWALHAYIDANNFSSKQTKAFLKAVGGKIWLTETGGVVRRTPRANSAKFKGSGVAHQEKVTDYLLKTIASDKRIERLYIYSWSSVGDLNWDSGLTGPAGEARPALNILRKYLGLPPVAVVS
jgi:hypothetical protein